MYSVKLSREKAFTNRWKVRENCVDLYSHPITCATPQNFVEKTSADGWKSMKFAKVFFLKSFPTIRYSTFQFSLSPPLPPSPNSTRTPPTNMDSWNLRESDWSRTWPDNTWYDDIVSWESMCNSWCGCGCGCVCVCVCVCECVWVCATVATLSDYLIRILT